MPKQVSVQLTKVTENQIKDLKARGFGNRTTIMRLAVDRMHREEIPVNESIMVKDLGQSGSIHAARAGDGRWYLGRFSLHSGQISNGRDFARGISASAVLQAGYDTPYATLDEARAAAQKM